MARFALGTMLVLGLWVGGCRSHGSGGSTVVLVPHSHGRTRPQTPPPPVASKPKPSPAASKPGPPAHAKAHGLRRQSRFYYYPDHQVYRSKETGRYYWLESGVWKVGIRLPSRIVISDRAVRVELDLDDEKPYHRHPEIVRSHPGKALGHDKDKGKGPGKGKGQGKGKGKGPNKDR